jgi:hypothetical protein
MRELTFDYRDIGKAPRLAWSIRKMYLALRGILLAWGIYLVFTYAALLFSPARSAGPGHLFRYFEFFPYVPVEAAGIPALLIWILGIVLALCTLLLAATAVSRVVIEDLRGNQMYQAGEAVLFTRANRWTVLISMLAMFFLVLISIVSFAITGLVGRIPAAGPLFLAIFSIPLFFWGLAGILALITFLIGITIVPAIVACLGEDVLETVIQTFLTIWSKPVLFLWYQIIIRVVTLFVTILLKILSITAFLFALTITAPFMGNSMNELFTISLSRIPFLLESREVVNGLDILNYLIGTPYVVDTTGASVIVHLSGWILGIGILFVVAWIVSYMFCTFFSSQVLMYLILYKRKEGKDLRAQENK